MDNYELLEAWKIAKEQGISLEAFASEYGLTRIAAKKRLWRTRKKIRAEGIIPGEPGIEQIQEDVNSLTVIYKGDRITTIEQLIEFCKVDMDIWYIHEPEITKWEGYRKAKKTKITYTDGKADGYIDDSGELNIQPLFRIRVKFRRIEPIQLSPVIQPVYISLDDLEVKPPEPKKIQRTLHISDTHFGYAREWDGEMAPLHNRESLSIILAIMEGIFFDRVVLSGDILDWSEFTDKFLKLPEIYFTTQPSLIEAAWFIGQIQKRTKRVDVVAGNHDERLSRLGVKQFIHGYGLKPADRLTEAPPMSVPGLLGLERMGIEYHDNYPNSFVQVAEDVIVKHGHKSSANSGQSITNLIKEIVCSTGIGHIHKIERANKTLIYVDKKINVIAYSPGCLCHLDGRVPGSKIDANWQNGLAIIETYQGDSEIDLYRIDERALIRGNIYEPFDYMDQLMDDTKLKDYLH